jgi:hypothetical protein
MEQDDKKDVPIAGDFDDYKVDFLGEFESIFETALAHESGP